MRSHSAEYRALATCVVEDLVIVQGLPEWPGAALLLDTCCNALSTALVRHQQREGRQAPGAAAAAAAALQSGQSTLLFNLLGRVCAR